jgi:hypothetical protein
MFSKFGKSKRRQSDSVPQPVKLPAGAEAALWSIVEVIPDPRNHLALTRDPTAEVRLTRSSIDAAAALAGPAAPRASWLPAQLPDQPEPAPAMPIARRNTVRWSSDTAEVRLPAFTNPQVAEPEPTGETDASVHALEAPTPPPLLAVQRRYARGA